MDTKKESTFPWGTLGLTLTGLAIGAAAGILLAPAEGKETRRRLGEWLKEKRQNSKEVLAERKAQVLGAIEAGKKAYQEKSAEKKQLVGV